MEEDDNTEITLLLLSVQYPHPLGSGVIKSLVTIWMERLTPGVFEILVPLLENLYPRGIK